jgi:hypothetical protein
MDGDVGTAQRGWPGARDAAINGKAWRPWNGGCRLALVRTQIAREAEDADATESSALDAIERARRATRPKYESAARALLGEAMLTLGRREEGLAELATATELADGLGGATPRWQTWALRSRLVRGRRRRRAAAAAREPGHPRGVVATLTPEHAAGVRRPRGGSGPGGRLTRIVAGHSHGSLVALASA